MTNENYLKVATSAAKESGKIFKQFFGKPKTVSIKNGNPRDQVTEVDLKIERLIRAKVKKNFPTHKIIGEEYGKSEILKNDFIWIIDPIDGTHNFIQGLPICCISIALWDNKGPLVGVVYNPLMEDLYTAIRGKGTYLNGKRIKTSGVKNIIQAFGGYGWGRNIAKASKTFPQLLRLLHKMRTLGSSTTELAFVASGIYDFHIQADINVWDFAASVLLITEAGGNVTDWGGKKIGLETKNLLAANKALHTRLVKKIKTIF